MERKPFVCGEKAALRVVEPEDADYLAYCHNSPDVRPWFFTNYPTNSLRQKECIEKIYENYEYVPLIIMNQQSKTDVGVTAFHRIDIVGGMATLSIILPDRENWNKGYGKEATHLMVEYGFDVLGFHRIQLVVAAKNSAARRIYASAGFQEEGVLREAMYQDGNYWDFIMMGLLASDWKQQKKGR